MMDGLLVSQLPTLFTTPVIYVFLDRLRGAARARSGDAARDGSGAMAASVPAE